MHPAVKHLQAAHDRQVRMREAVADAAREIAAAKSSRIGADIAEQDGGMHAKPDGYDHPGNPSEA